MRSNTEARILALEKKVNDLYNILDSKNETGTTADLRFEPAGTEQKPPQPKVTIIDALDIVNTMVSNPHAYFDYNEYTGEVEAFEDYRQLEQGIVSRVWRVI